MKEKARQQRAHLLVRAHTEPVGLPSHVQNSAAARLPAVALAGCPLEGSGRPGGGSLAHIAMPHKGHHPFAGELQ